MCNEDDPEEKEKLVLTGWANAHVDDCCLRFVRLYVQQNVGRYVYGRLYYDAALVKQEEFYLSDLINERQLSVPDAKYEYNGAEKAGCVCASYLLPLFQRFYKP